MGVYLRTDFELPLEGLPQHQDVSGLHLRRASRCLFILFCCFRGLTVLGQGQDNGSETSAEVAKSFDRFQGLTTLQSNSSLRQVNEKYSNLIFSDSSLSTYFLCKGDADGCSTTSVTLRFEFQSRMFLFQDASIIFLIDGAPLKVPEPRRLSSVLGPRMSELMSIDVPIATFRKIAQARTAEVQIGTIDFALTESNIGALKAVEARIASSPAPATKQIQPAKKKL